MIDFIIAILAIFAALTGWIWVQQLARRFAERYPQFGPAREEGSGCGTSCMCTGGTCANKKPGQAGRADANNRDNRIYIE